MKFPSVLLSDYPRELDSQFRKISAPQFLFISAETKEWQLKFLLRRMRKYQETLLFRNPEQRVRPNLVSTCTKSSVPGWKCDFPCYINPVSEIFHQNGALEWVISIRQSEAKLKSPFFNLLPAHIRSLDDLLDFYLIGLRHGLRALFVISEKWR